MFSWCRKTLLKENNRVLYTIRTLSGRLYSGQFISGYLIFWTLIGLLMTNFTPEELLQYLYKETSPKQTSAIEQALKQDWTLKEKLAVLKASMERLDKITESPRTEVVLKVLNYVRETSAEAVE
jgi:hypothetical protein